VKPDEIEKRSFEIILNELSKPLDPITAPIVLRAIHTTADFEYADSLTFSDGAVEIAIALLKRGVHIVSDT
jgi:precorrin-8X/cobalt-precorrin-8 methylmutase